jgi:hypothetical protein
MDSSVLAVNRKRLDEVLNVFAHIRAPLGRRRRAIKPLSIRAIPSVEGRPPGTGGVGQVSVRSLVLVLVLTLAGWRACERCSAVKCEALAGAEPDLEC